MPEQRQRFRGKDRLSGKLAFAGVYGAKVRIGRGPLVVYSRPNDAGHLRLGLSVSRAVGMAVRRNRMKRLVREAFRMLGEQRTMGLDLVVVVRPHEPLMLDAYRQLLGELVVGSWKRWRAE